MALGGKTVQYTLAVDMQTGQLTAESKRVATELNLIQKQTAGASGGMVEFGRSIKQLKSELSLLFLGSFGGYALAINLLGDAVSYVTSTLKGFMEGVKFDKAALADLNTYVDGLRNAGKAQSELIELKIKDLEAQIKINEAQNKTASVGSTIFTGNIYSAIGAISAWIGMKKEENRVIEENTKQQKNQYELLDDLKQLRGEMASKEFLNRSVFGAAPTSIPGIERDNAPAKQFQDLNLAIGVTMPNLEAITSTEEQMREEMVKYGATSREELQSIKAELDNLATSGFMTFINGMVAGFESVGAAIVNGQNTFKSFGAVFLKTIAQLAIQFGTFLILVGTGMSAVGTLFGFSGAGAIAAGVALTIFGGALGALAAKAGGSGAGGRTSEREQRFRDSRFNTAGGGGTTINNYINFQNTIGLTREAMKEVGEAVSKEIFKQTKLGRVETVPA